MRYALLAAVLLLVGCGHHESAAPHVPGPFADIDGTYAGTFSSNGGTYAAWATPASTLSATISDAGVVSTVVHGQPVTYQLTRLGDGSFQTDRRTVDASHYEVGTAPASLATFTLTGYETVGDAWVGDVTYTLVQTASG